MTKKQYIEKLENTIDTLTNTILDLKLQAAQSEAKAYRDVLETIING